MADSSLVPNEIRLEFMAASLELQSAIDEWQPNLLGNLEQKWEEARTHQAILGHEERPGIQWETPPAMPPEWESEPPRFPKLNLKPILEHLISDHRSSIEHGIRAWEREIRFLPQAARSE